MIDRVVLDVQLAHAEALRQTGTADERRIPRMEAGPRLTGNRQQFPIAPEVLRPALDLVAGQRNSRIVVHRFERPQAPLAYVGGLCRRRCLAHVTLQSDERAHTASGRFLNRLMIAPAPRAIRRTDAAASGVPTDLGTRDRRRSPA